METRPASPADALDQPIDVDPPALPRQRWRLVLARAVDAPALAGRDLADTWESALEASGLPVFRPLGRPRPRVAFGAPIPASMALERELADIVLTELLPAWRVREQIVELAPDGWRLIDIYDVWLGGPALAGLVAAADYRIDVGDADAGAVAAAAATILASATLERTRAKGGSSVRYDLRPLLVDVGVAHAAPTLTVRARTRFHPVLGTGRPEEVVAALGEVAGIPLTVGSIVRERLLLADELD